jgi:dihydrofolate reductase
MRIIAAVDRNWGLGYENELQFRISADLKRFRQLTTGGIIIYGRKTLQTFPGGKPLKNRINLILSTEIPDMENAVICRNQKEAFSTIRKYFEQGYFSDQIYIIGGASVYEQFLPYCRQAMITYIHDHKAADCYFPDLDKSESWILTEKTDIQKENDLRFEYRVYTNIKPEEL